MTRCRDWKAETLIHYFLQPLTKPVFVLSSFRILVLDAGKIAEFDEPQALLQNQDSIFYGMAKDAGLV